MINLQEGKWTAKQLLRAHCCDHNHYWLYIAKIALVTTYIPVQADLSFSSEKVSESVWKHDPNVRPLKLEQSLTEILRSCEFQNILKRQSSSWSCSQLLQTDVLTKSAPSLVYRQHKQKTRWLLTETKALVKCAQDNFLQLQITSYVSTALGGANIFT